MQCKFKLQSRSKLYDLKYWFASVRNLASSLIPKSQHGFSHKEAFITLCSLSTLISERVYPSHSFRISPKPLDTFLFNSSLSALRFMSPNHIITWITGHRLKVNMLQIKHISPLAVPSFLLIFYLY